jgi:release factor glutamine methyltransferase
MKKGTTLRDEIDRIQGIPKQYQQGWTEFYKLKFHLTPDVLIPRPETELLVDEVLAFARHPEFISGSQSEEKSPTSEIPKQVRNDKLVTIVDIGTGSGCIAIAIAKNLPNSRIFALEISPAAIKIAEKNAAIHKVDNKILFMESDLIAALTIHSGKVQPDIIVANLPYIPTPRLMLIDPMVRDFEPTVALDGGIDGFELYRKLFIQMLGGHPPGVNSDDSSAHLEGAALIPKVLIAEIDEEQGEVALAETKRFFPKAKVEVKKDFYGSDRILKITFNS